MKDKLFPLFITMLGLFTAYVFYALWHSEELTHVETSTKKPKDKSVTHTKILTQGAVEIKTSIPQSKDPIVMPSRKEMRAKTQEVYEVLIPEGHEDLMEESEQAFEALDAKVIEMKEVMERERSY